MMQMNTTRSVITLLFVSLLVLTWGCQPQVKVSPAPEAPETPVVEKKEEVPLIPILMAEAEKFANQGNHQDALLIYNQVLDKAESAGISGEADKKAVLTAIESVLKQASAEDIDTFSGIRNLTIPGSLLQYWLGAAHIREENYTDARTTLEAFIASFPDDSKIIDAQALLDKIQTAAFSKDTIGCLLPLSGKYSIYGERALKGIQLAVRELSQKHGRPFNVIVKDTRSDPDQAIQCVEELAREEVLGILGPLLVPESAGQKAQELGIPLIALTQKREFPLGGDYLFSNFITPEMQVQALGSYVFMELGLKKVAILYPDEKYGRRYMELFWDVVDEFNGEMVGVEAYDGTKTDFTIPVQKLTGEFYPVPEFLKPKPEEPEESLFTDDGEMAGGEEETNPKRPKLSSRGSAVANEDRIEIDFQALFIPDGLSRVNLILPQLAFNDARGMVLLGTNLWHQKSLLTQARGYNKNTVITDGYFGGSSRPVTQAFDKNFREVFKEAPGFLEAISYDTASILFTAAMDDTAGSRKDIRDNLQGRIMFDGVTGQTIFDKDGSPHKELFLITVKRGKFLEISR
ncbi:MAG TPA: penicillin-binding protein activator [Desulfobacteraceae bacterium]|nr:penicillin-binding protein activator [Desulfobacteraceae bacterium]